MAKGDVPSVERIIADTINETARGDPDALATHIVAALLSRDIVLSGPTGWRTPRSALSHSTN